MAQNSKPNPELITELLSPRVSLSNISDAALVAVVEARFPRNPDGTQGEETVAVVKGLLGLKNPMQVSRLVAEARRRKLFRVEITQVGDAQNFPALLRRRYPFLKIIESVGKPENDNRELMKALGLRAAQIFDKICVERGSTAVSIGGGDTMRHMVQQLPRIERRVTFGPTALLTRSAIEKVYDSPFLAMFAHWESLSLSEANICAIPPLPTQKSKEKVSDYRKRISEYCGWYFNDNQAVRDVVEKSFDPDVVFFGVSDFNSKSRILRNTYSLFGYSFEQLYDMGARVDLNYSILDASGQDLSSEIAKQLGVKGFYEHSHPFLTAMSPARFKQLAEDHLRPREVILVAGSHYKIKCVKALLDARIINGLITDEVTLTALATQE